MVVSLRDFDFVKLSLVGLIGCISGVLMNLLKLGSRIIMSVYYIFLNFRF